MSIINNSPVFCISFTAMILSWINLKYCFSPIVYILFIFSFIYFFKKYFLFIISVFVLVIILDIRSGSLESHNATDGIYTFYINEKASDNFYYIKTKCDNFTLHSKKKLIEGQYYRGFLKFSKLYSTANFFEFEYSKFLNSKKIFYNAYSENLIPIDKKHFFYYYKARFSSNLYNLYKDNKGYLLASSLIFNQKQSKKQLYDIFKNLNISHFIAFSGMHLGVFLFINEKLFKRFNYTNYSVVFLAYIMSNFSLSCLRAISIYLMNKINCFFGREAYSLENLGLFIIIFTILNPFIVYNPSFFYSVLFYSQILIFYKKKFITIIIFAIETLFIMRSISVYYIFLNIFLISFFPLIILSSLLFFLFYKFSFAYIFLLPHNLTLNLLEFLNKNNLIFNLNLKYLFIISVFLLLIFRQRKYALFFFTVLLFLQFYPYLIVFDTGHGQSILFNWNGKYILFDGGNSDYRFDITLENFLKLTGKRLNTVLISHNDSDHYSGLINIDKERFIKKLILPQSDNFIKGNEFLYNNNYFMKERFYSMYINRKNSSDRNEYSFFYFLKIFNKKIFFCSDVSASISSEYMSLYNNASHYIVVGHHGGKGSLSQEIIDKNPNALYIISCSNRYNNPHYETVSFLKNSKHLSTRNFGAIFIDPLTGITISHKK